MINVRMPSGRVVPVFTQLFSGPVEEIADSASIFCLAKVVSVGDNDVAVILRDDVDPPIILRSTIYSQYFQVGSSYIIEFDNNQQINNYWRLPVIPSTI